MSASDALHQLAWQLQAVPGTAPYEVVDAVAAAAAELIAVGLASVGCNCHMRRRKGDQVAIGCELHWFDCPEVLAARARNGEWTTGDEA